mgnify:CR=1 FL=1
MKRRVAKWIGGSLLSALSIMIYLVLFQTHLFSSASLSILNTHFLNPKSIHLAGDLGGALFNDELSLRHAEVSVLGDTLLTAENIRLLNWEWLWDTKELIVSKIFFENYTLNLQHTENIFRHDSKSANQLSIILNHITGQNGQIAFNTTNGLEVIHVLELDADLWLIDGFTQAKLSSAIIFIPGQISDTLTIAALVEVDDEGGIDINALKIQAADQELNLKARLSQGDYTATINGSNFSPKLLDDLVLPEPLSNAKLNIKLLLDRVNGNLNISGTGALELKENRHPFKLKSYHKNYARESIDIQVGTQNSLLDLKATRDTSGTFNGMAELYRFNLFNIFSEHQLKILEPTGNISFQGDRRKYLIVPRLTSFMVNTLRFDSLQAEITVEPSGILAISDGIITQDNNRLDFSGSISEEQLDLIGKIDFTDYSFIENASSNGKISGSISSIININGSLSEPHITGIIRPKSLSYDDMLSLTGLGKIDLMYRQGTLIGEFALKGNKGFLLGDSLKSFSILTAMSDRGFSLADLNIQGSKNMISMSGNYGQPGIELNKFNFIMESNQLKLADTVHIQRNKEQEYFVPSSVLNFNKGGIALSGIYSLENGLNIDAEFELIDLKQVLKFIRVKQAFSGLSSGEAHVTGRLSDPLIHIKMQLLDGVTLGYPSDSANIDLTMSSSMVFSNGTEAFTNKGSLKLNGQLPWGYKIAGSRIGDTPQFFSIALKNYRLKDLNFSSVAGFPISGRATGSISIRGNPENSKLDGQLSIVDASFDTLKFSTAYTDFDYDGNLLTFDSLSMVSNWGYGSGTGFIPISLDLIAPDRMRAANRNIGLDFNFILNELPFLSSYISTIDAIHGDFIGRFSLSGPLNSPVRTGHIRGHNARLDLSDLGNPITDIHSEISLIDNTLTIDHFSGRMLFSEGSNLQVQGVVGYLTSNITELIGVKGRQEYAGVVTAEGSIDLRSFFEPRFDLKMKANEVYYRSTDGLIEAIADAEMQVTGQDTLDITAIIPVKRAAYYSNFESEESYRQLVSTRDSTLFRYSLDAIFSSDLLISNDQMEAEFEGELWLLDYGDGIMRFSGTLTVVEGGKFYYLGNELALISGEIIFNSVDFNPQISMEAEILIEGEKVRLILSGDLDEPELVINAENTTLTQTNVLTYLTINQKLLEEGFDRTTALDPVKTYSEMLVEKQLSKIGRDIIGLDILDIGINLGRGDTTTVSRFEVGQRLSKNLKITAAGDFQPTDGKTDYDFGLEYQINQNVSVTSKINQNGEVELNGRLKFTY